MERLGPDVHLGQRAGDPPLRPRAGGQPHPRACHPDRRRVDERLRRLHVQQQVPDAQADVRRDPQTRFQPGPVGHPLDRHERAQLQLRQGPPLLPDVGRRPQQGLPGAVVGRPARCGDRRPRESGRAGLVRRSAAAPGEGLRHQRVQVRHPVLRPELPGRIPATPPTTISSSGRSSPGSSTSRGSVSASPGRDHSVTGSSPARSTKAPAGTPSRRPPTRTSRSAPSATRSWRRT